MVGDAVDQFAAGDIPDLYVVAIRPLYGNILPIGRDRQHANIQAQELRARSKCDHCADERSGAGTPDLHEYRAGGARCYKITGLRAGCLDGRNDGSIG